MTHSLAPIESQALAVWREPTEAIAEAKKAADALIQVINSKPKALIFNDEQYIEIDDWQLVGSFYGCTADIEWTRPIEIVAADHTSMIRGWEARAIMRDRTGRILTHAEAMCLDDEDKWKARPKYEWQYVCKDGSRSTDDPGRDQIIWEPTGEQHPDGRPKSRPQKERNLVGTTAVPSFQLRSMAQTRAIAKAHSNIFRWVVTLAGYKATPAEEMDGMIEYVDNQTHSKDTERSLQQHPEPVDGDWTTDIPAEVPEKPATVAQETRSPVPATSAPSRPVAVPAPGTTIVAEVGKPVTGKSASGQWTYWPIRFADGRRASTFSETTMQQAQDAMITSRPVVAVIVPGKKPNTFNLEKLEVR